MGLLFFFFQAEDGIRDLTVTGVQTCALPISKFIDYSGAVGPCRFGGPFRNEIHRLTSLPVGSYAHASGICPSNLDDTARSEERRVGKECRSRWSPYH